MLQNKTIWITGASSGIGEACAYLFAREKCNLILTATRTDRLAAVRQECIRLGARCEILPYDLSDLTQIDTLTDHAIALFGNIDIAFLNAGISQRSTTLETSPGVDEKIMQVNFFAPVKITKQLLPSMIAQGGGTIAVTTSISGKFGFPLRSAYAASKFALYGFFETVQAEYYNDRIRVVMVCPGRHKNKYFLQRTGGRREKTRADGQGAGERDAGREGGTQDREGDQKQKPEVLVGGSELLMVYIKRFLPSLSRRLARRINPT